MMPFAGRCLAALLTGCLYTLCFPNFDLGFLAWVALIPLLLATRGRSLPSAFFLSGLAGISAMMGVFYWINAVRGFSLLYFVLLGLYLAPYFAVFGALNNFLARKSPSVPAVILTPALWVSMEYLRAHAGFLSLPWCLMGHSQYRYPGVLQVLSVTGVYGLSFLVVMVNTSICELVPFAKKNSRTGRTRPMLYVTILLPAAFLGASIGYSYAVTRDIHDVERFPVTVIQPNIPQDIKWDPEYRETFFRKLLGLTDNALTEAHSPLVVWPEAAIQEYLLESPMVLSRTLELLRRHNVSLVVGTAHRPKVAARPELIVSSRNSAILLSGKGTLAVYDKVHLLPFAEYVPLKGVVPWPANMVSRASNFTPGKKYSTFELDGKVFSPPVCWETVFPEEIGRFVDRGARFLVNITNEAWFGDTAAPRQFLMMAVCRAVEHRVSIVRCANTGISCFISPSGEVYGRVHRNGRDLFVEGFLTMDVAVTREKTIYTRFGEWFALSCLTLVIVSLVVALERTFDGETHADG